MGGVGGLAGWAVETGEFEARVGWVCASTTARLLRSGAAADRLETGLRLRNIPGPVFVREVRCLFVAFRSLCNFPFDLGEPIATGGEESEVGRESRRRVPPRRVFSEAGLD